MKSKVKYLIFFLSLWGTFALADQVKIDFAREALVEEDTVRLGAIARIHCEDNGLRLRLTGLAVEKAPLPGRSADIDTNKVLYRIRQAYKGSFKSNYDLIGAVKVTSASSEITAERIREKVASFLQKRIGMSGGRKSITRIQVNRSRILPAGEVRMEIFLPEETALSGWVHPEVRFFVDERQVDMIRVLSEIESLRQVAVVKKSLGRYQPIRKEDIRMEWRNEADLPKTAVFRPESVIGKRTRRKIPPKTVLREDFVEFPPLVQRGDVVKIVAEAGGVKVVTFGKVRERGRYGEQILVENLNSGKKIYARVENADTVRVGFAD